MKLRVLACLLLLGGPWMTTGAQPGQTLAATPSDIWIDVPFAAQTKDGCGSASMAMVMRYWDMKESRPVAAGADPEAIQGALFSRAASGIYASRMQKYFRFPEKIGRPGPGSADPVSAAGRTSGR